MEILAAIAPLLTLALALYERWAKTQPGRDRAKLERDHDADIERADVAIGSGDAGELSALFETERQEGLKRGAVDPRGGDPRGADVNGLRDLPAGAGDAAGPGGGPPDPPAA